MNGYVGLFHVDMSVVLSVFSKGAGWVFRERMPGRSLILFLFAATGVRLRPAVISEVVFRADGRRSLGKPTDRRASSG